MSSSKHFVEAQLAELKYQKEQQRIITRLAEALQFAFQIREGTQLVAILGTGQEHNNLDALKTWVHRELTHVDETIAITMLPMLAKRLAASLQMSIFE